MSKGGLDLPQNDIDKILEELKARRQRSKTVSDTAPQPVSKPEPDVEKQAEETVKEVQISEKDKATLSRFINNTDKDSAPVSSDSGQLDTQFEKDGYVSKIDSVYSESMVEHFTDRMKVYKVKSGFEFLKAFDFKLNYLKSDKNLNNADELTLYVTEQDYLTIRNNYKWKDVEILDAYESKKDYLPKAFIEYILELYGYKTTLKDVKGKEDLYLQSKQYVNSLFGMAVTAIIQSDVILEDDVWSISNLTEEQVDNYLEKLRKTNRIQKKYFLSYSWGVYVTAYARRNLWKCIEYCDIDMLYCDTDSIFVMGDYDFSWYNEEITAKLKKACEYHDIDFEKTRPKAPNGKVKPLGIFDREFNCIEFISLGAKRYVERRELIKGKEDKGADGKLHLTVSGINKGAVELLEDEISNFRDGFDFDKDSDCVTKRLTTYITDMPVTIWNDGYVSTYTKGINLRRNGYKLTMTDSYKDLINYFDRPIEDIPDQWLIALRGKF